MDILIVVVALAVVIGISYWLINHLEGRAWELQPPPEHAEYEGIPFWFRRFTQPAAGTERDPTVVMWAEICAPLPGALSHLGLIDLATTETHASLSPTYDDVPIGHMPRTPDQTFNGLFDYTTTSVHPAVHEALQDEEVRAALLEMREAFDGLWVDGGTVKVYSRGGTTRVAELDDAFRPSVMFRTDVELLSTQLQRIEARLPDLEPSDFVLDLDDETAAATSPAEAAGDSHTAG